MNSEDGSLPQIHRPTISLRVVLITKERLPGSLKAVFLRTGSPVILCCGSTENVRSPKFLLAATTRSTLFVAGSGKSILWFVSLHLFLPGRNLYSRSALQLLKILWSYARRALLLWHIFILTSGTPINKPAGTCSFLSSRSFLLGRILVLT